MRQIQLLLATIIAATTHILAQTGDGGGIQIMHIAVHDAYNYRHQPEQIIPITDTALSIQYFILSDDAKHKVVKEYKPKNIRSYRFGKIGKGPHVYIPYYTEGKHGKQKNIINQRMVLAYKRDTMVVDFIDIPTFNANGFTDMIELLKLYPHGHFKLYRNIYTIHPELKDYANKKTWDTLHHVMRKGFNDSTYTYLHEMGMVADIKYHTNVSLIPNNGLLDAVDMKYLPVYSIKPSNIVLMDPETHLNAEQIHLTISEPAVVSNDELQYRLLLDFYFPPRGRLGARAPIPVEEQHAINVLKAFATNALYINNHTFTGTIRMYYNSYWDTIVANGATYDLIICTYSAGKLISTNHVKDVGSIDSESGMVRPT